MARPVRLKDKLPSLQPLDQVLGLAILPGRGGAATRTTLDGEQASRASWHRSFGDEVLQGLAF